MQYKCQLSFEALRCPNIVVKELVIISLPTHLHFRSFSSLPSVYDGILGLTETDGVNTVIYNLPNLTRSVDRINNAFNETFLQKILDGKFLISDLFSNTTELKNKFIVSGMARDVIEDLFNGSFDLTDLYETFNGTINFEPFCRNQFLNYVLTVDNSTDASVLIEALCQMNIRNLTSDINIFLNDLNRDVIDRYVSSRDCPRGEKCLDFVLVWKFISIIE